MKLQEFKDILKTKTNVSFQLANGKTVPAHFHVTEVGQIDKNYIDCGGTIRKESKVNFQLWEADDFDHRLLANKLLGIIELSEDKLNIQNHDIEVEYQSDTIGKYELTYNGENFVLGTTLTDCLAKDKCGVPEEKTKIKIADLPVENSCAPGSGCC
jgi:hypothetical protein